ncbi:MAG: hypothetical protein KJ592_02570 [Nanoarchaeota archaeon]|nr:hypothetical protein [Nanoarchaeota archaeon]
MKKFCLNCGVEKDVEARVKTCKRCGERLRSSQKGQRIRIVNTLSSNSVTKLIC